MVRKGYKKTEIGVIPEDWEVINIQTALDEKYIEEQMDGNHGQLYPRSHDFVSYGIPYIGANDFLNGKVNLKNCKFISQVKAKQFKKGIAQNGDVLFAHNATVGPVALLQFDGDFLILSTTATYFRCNQERIYNLYLRFVLEAQYFIKQYKAVMAQSTRFQVPITTQRKFLIAVPLIEEQKVLAQALYDVDALITALDKLIAKKRHIKTGTMQQLLAGKKRLPGFGEGKGYKQTEVGLIPEDWEINTLGEMTEYIKGFAFKAADFQLSGVRVIRVSDTTFDFIKDDSEIFIDEKKAKNFKKWAINENDLIISTVGSKPPMYDSMVGKATFVNQKNAGSLLNQNAVIVRSNNWSQESQVFLHNNLKQARYIEHIEKIFRGNANQASITLKELFGFLIPTPKDEKEQQAIASVLSDMDAEITALETRRAKTQAIKQGMMQELLTGKTRLI